jgi:hypothetical protein
VNNAHLLRVRSILELSEKRLAEAVAQVGSRCFRCQAQVSDPWAEHGDAEELRCAG